jgi:hypothetical protein
MECSEIRAILLEYADSEVPPELGEKVGKHLAACRSCGALRAALEEQSAALGRLPRLAAPEGLLGAVKSRLEKPSLLLVFTRRLHGFFATNRFFRLAGAGVAAMLVILAVHVAFRENTLRGVSPSKAPTATEAPPPEAEHSPFHGAPSPPAPSPLASLAAPRPGLGAKKALRAGVPQAKHNGPAFARNQTVMLTLVWKAPAGSAGEKTGGAVFRPDRSSHQRSRSLPASLAASAEGNRMSSKGLSRGTAGFAPAPRSGSRGVIDEVIRLVERANGKVSRGPNPRYESWSGPILVELPEANLHSFIAGMRKLGEVRWSQGKEPAPGSKATVRVSISLEKE